MQMRLELIPLPCDDVDAAVAFYADQIGFHLDHDVSPGNGMRIVQLTPPGSACSIVLGIGMLPPGTASIQGIHLVVDSIGDAAAELRSRGVDVSDAYADSGGVSYAHFADPDGNSWTLQQIDRGAALPTTEEQDLH